MDASAEKTLRIFTPPLGGAGFTIGHANLPFEQFLSLLKEF